VLAAFGIRNESSTFAALFAAYSQNHRYYHTAQHIDHCLRELDAVLDLAAEPAEVELALWFHDAVYEPMSSNNEERSADWASELLSQHGVAAARVANVRAHIMATRHDAPATLPDSQLVVDIDLSILGADDATYAQFERNVRKEYQWVPLPLFRRKRAEILNSFLGRPRIYNTDRLYTRFEQQARHNLREAIRALGGSRQR
jgi:predicted metal-dependent HD superfamily phosphohydrolase